MKNRGLLFWLIVGGAGLFVLGFVVSGAIAVTFINSDASKAAERLVDGHPDLAEFIGSPMSVDWWRSGLITTNEKLGVATFTLTVAGARGETSVRVLLVRPADSDAWESVFAAVVDGQGRTTLSLDPNRIPSQSPLTKGLREHVRTLSGIGALDIRLDGGDVTLVRWQR